MSQEMLKDSRSELYKSIEAASRAADKALENWTGDAAVAFRKETKRFYSRTAAEWMRQTDRLIGDAAGVE